MVTRLREFSVSDKYKVQWMSSWGAKRALYQFLARRCSKEFLDLYLEEDPDILNRVSEPGLSLDVVPEVDLAVRLHEVGLLPEENRKKFVEAVSNYAIDGEDVYALEDNDIRHVFTDGEFEELVRVVRMKLLPRLAEVRERVQMNHDSSESPDEHMQRTIELFNALKMRFSDDVNAIRIIERETELANEWIVETDPPEPSRSPRILGSVEPAEERRGSRSIFDDIDDREA